MLLTTLSEAPKAGCTLSGNSEWTSTDLVLGLGTGEAAAALVQRVEARVAADGGLARRYAAGAGQRLGQIHTEMLGSDITFDCLCDGTWWRGGSVS